VLENVKILKMLLERKPDLSISNKKGQTAIDITKSKIIINIFWHYLKGMRTQKPKEEEKGEGQTLADEPTVDLTKSKPTNYRLAVEAQEAYAGSKEPASEATRKHLLLPPEQVPATVHKGDD
jgi:hypothetical protein